MNQFSCFPTFRPAPAGALPAAALAAMFAIASPAHAADTLTVATDSQPLTMINVLTPKKGVSVSELADKLVLGLTDATSTFDGYLGSAVHKSLDDSVVVVYAQWENQASVDEAVRRITSGDAPEHAEAFGMSAPVFHPYEVVAVVPAKD